MSLKVIMGDQDITEYVNPLTVEPTQPPQPSTAIITGLQASVEGFTAFARQVMDFTVTAINDAWSQVVAFFDGLPYDLKRRYGWPCRKPRARRRSTPGPVAWHRSKRR